MDKQTLIEQIESSQLPDGKRALVLDANETDGDITVCWIEGTPEQILKTFVPELCGD